MQIHMLDIYSLCYKYIFFCAGLKLNSWRQVFDKAVNSINYGKQDYRSNIALLKEYFTRPAVVIPQNMSSKYKYEVGQTVMLDLSPEQRKKLSFKYSLNPGNNQEKKNF